MPMIRYKNANADHFQGRFWNFDDNDDDDECAIEESLSTIKMRRASSVAYSVDTRHSEQPLLLFLPNKVEFYCNTNRDQFGAEFDITEPNSSPRRHSSGNCETKPSGSPTAVVPPPIPARLNKVPAIPKRKCLPKLVAATSFSTDTDSTALAASFENGSHSTGKPMADFRVILPPPPPQPPTYSIRSAVSTVSSQNKGTSAVFGQSGQCETKPGQADDRKVAVANGALSDIKTLTPLQNAALFNSLQNKSSGEGYFKFPKASPVPCETESSSSSEDLNNFTLARRKSGKMIPPPIHTYTNQTIGDAVNECSSNFCDMSKGATCHDSQLSCSDGGMSQTSSPSYLVRSLESPLLPKVNSHSTNKHSKRKFITDKLFSDMNNFTMAKENKRLSRPDLTKSQSTPGELQTVVDYQPRATLPYQHKIIIDENRTPYISGNQLKIQYVPIVVNVIVLLVVAGALAVYLRAYPHVTTVKYVNHTIISFPNVSHRPTSPYYSGHPPPNEEGYYCAPLTARFCIVNSIPYNYTILPNIFGSTYQRQAETELDVYEALTNVRCYQLASLYLCSLYLPKCGHDGLPVNPCRNLCLETHRRCGLFMAVFGLQLPKQIDCTSFPVSDNPDECIGSSEVEQHLIQEKITVCHDGFKCDQTRCIPADWRCDGHIDCEDETDESNCAQCPGQLHCGMGRCIATSHICDGVLNCPWGQDERNCVRLNKQMGDLGFGAVEVFVAENKAFRQACIQSWDQQNSPKLICELLGYEHTNSTDLQNKSENSHLQYIQYNKETVEENKIRMFHDLKACNNDGRFPIVKATCSSYACGIRKQSLGWPNARIVGGVQSNPGDWPFLAAILGGPEEIFYCAGVLISDQWVLSAAHCVGHFNLSHAPDWTIQLGMTRRSSHSYFGQKLKVRRVIPHPEYNEGIPHNNDIALFQLEERVTFHDHLLPVCMPNKTTVLKPPRNCTVIGWGKREDNDVSDYEPTVYEVQVPILSRTLCNTWLENRDLKVSPGMICAGYEHGGKDACQGDSGGPLLCQEDGQSDKWFVGGIVSWGIKCAHPHLPGIYANVPRFVTWIERQMSQLKTKPRY